jgi:hypothetical protein
MDDNDPIVLGDMCTSPNWWVNRGIIYKAHAVERAQVRRILLPDKFIDCTDLIKGYDDKWIFRTSIENHKCVVVATPVWRRQQCYVSVVTIYYYSPGREGRKIERQTKRFLRQVKRSGRSISTNAYNDLIRIKEKPKNEDG